MAGTVQDHEKGEMKEQEHGEMKEETGTTKRSLPLRIRKNKTRKKNKKVI